MPSSANRRLGFISLEISRKELLEFWRGFRQRRTRFLTGFTLIEIMVSVAIIGILTTIIFVSFANTRERTAVRHAAENAEIKIRETQNRAQSGELLGGNLEVPGYGIYFEALSGQYIVFADNGSDDDNRKYHDGNDTVVETVALPNNVVIALLTVDDPNYEPDRLHLTYQVPTAAVTQLAESDFKAEGEYSASSSSIVFRHLKADICYSISVNTMSGAISRRQLESCP